MITRDRKLRDITKNLDWKELNRIYKREKYKKEMFLEIFPIGGLYKRSIQALQDMETMHLIDETIRGECYFYKSNKCWVDVDSKGVIRYFSIDYNKGTYFYLSLSDLYRIFMGTGNFNKILKELFKDYKIKVEEEDWKMKEEQIYLNNVEYLENNNLKNNYPFLHRIIKSNMLILQELNLVSIGRILSLDDSYEGRSLIPMPSNYLSDELNRKGKDIEVKASQSKVSRALNLYCLLGLIEKVQKKDLPENILEREKKEAKDRMVGTNNLRTIYIIKELDDELLIKAEERAMICRDKKISISNISFNKVMEAFGSDLALQIYKDTRRNTIKSMRVREKNKENEKEIQDEIKNISLPF